VACRVSCFCYSCFTQLSLRLGQEAARSGSCFLCYTCLASHCHRIKQKTVQTPRARTRTRTPPPYQACYALDDIKFLNTHKLAASLPAGHTPPKLMVNAVNANLGGKAKRALRARGAEREPRPPMLEYECEGESEGWSEGEGEEGEGEEEDGDGEGGEGEEQEGEEEQQQAGFQQLLAMLPAVEQQLVMQLPPGQRSPEAIVQLMQRRNSAQQQQQQQQQLMQQQNLQQQNLQQQHLQQQHLQQHNLQQQALMAQQAQQQAQQQQAQDLQLRQLLAMLSPQEQSLVLQMPAAQRPQAIVQVVQRRRSLQMQQQGQQQQPQQQQAQQAQQAQQVQQQQAQNLQLRQPLAMLSPQEQRLVMQMPAAQRQQAIVQLVQRKRQMQAVAESKHGGGT
jgi:hypothetical protein